MYRWLTLADLDWPVATPCYLRFNIIPSVLFLLMVLSHSLFYHAFRSLEVELRLCCITSQMFVFPKLFMLNNLIWYITTVRKKTRQNKQQLQSPRKQYIIPLFPSACWNAASECRTNTRLRVLTVIEWPLVTPWSANFCKTSKRGWHFLPYFIIIFIIMNIGLVVVVIVLLQNSVTVNIFRAWDLQHVLCKTG